MNSFYVPALAGQIYAMPGMQTRLNAVINKPGVYQGFSANYSGAGFSGMHFAFRGMDRHDFERWVAEVKQSREVLNRESYLKLERPSENEPVRHYATADSALFDAILNMCVEPGKMCMREMAAIDAKGGMGLKSAGNLLPLHYDKFARRGTAGTPAGYVASVCTPADPDRDSEDARAALPNASPMLGAGLPRPPSLSSRFSPALPPAMRGASNS
jgi:cytochrome o ubiquinol oxidase subunit 2